MANVARTSPMLTRPSRHTARLTPTMNRIRPTAMTSTPISSSTDNRARPARDCPPVSDDAAGGGGSATGGRSSNGPVDDPPVLMGDVYPPSPDDGCGLRDRNLVALSGAAVLPFDDATRQSLGAHDQLGRHAEEIRVRELHTCRRVGPVVVQHRH